MYICDICRSLTGHFAIILQCPHDTECARSDAKTRDHPCNFEQRVQLAFCQVFCSLTALFNRVLQIGVWVRLPNPSVHALDYHVLRQHDIIVPRASTSYQQRGGARALETSKQTNKFNDLVNYTAKSTDGNLRLSTLEPLEVNLIYLQHCKTKNVIPKCYSACHSAPHMPPAIPRRHSTLYITFLGRWKIACYSSPSTTSRVVVIC